MALTTPIEGLVVERAATLGQMVEPQATLFLVMDLRRVWLQVDVYEQDLAQVRAGQRALVRLKAAPGEDFSGLVENVGALVDPRSRTVKVRVVLDNPRGVLKPGMFATVTIEGTSGEKRRGLYVPSEAVQRLGQEHVVFVARGEGAFEPRRVKVAHDGAAWTELARGVAAGETVVTRGAFALKSELKKDELGGEE
jgi:RND family efflux transporter MFP subunit